MFSENSTHNLDSTAALDPVHRKTLQHMSRIEKLILALTYHEGLSLRETGVVLGLSESDVRRTLASIESRFARTTALTAV